ncbi:MAG: hypothetical protein MJ208_00680 [Bacilli bacterium]|nr:hypothetical protein [Bacilli bacterium]
MKYVMTPHRHADVIFQTNEDLRDLWLEVKAVLDGISDEDLIKRHNDILKTQPETKSISKAINALIKERLEAKKWHSESEIFADPNYRGRDGTWRLDFAKGENGISIEVAFNHGGNCSWNLIKPVLASELNHVKKAIQTQAGILICATNKMKKAGGFDGAVGSYEKFLEYLKPLSNLLPTPILVIGLLPPKTFKVVQRRDEHNRRIGRCEMIETGELR